MTGDGTLWSRGSSVEPRFVRPTNCRSETVPPNCLEIASGQREDQHSTGKKASGNLFAGIFFDRKRSMDLAPASIPRDTTYLLRETANACLHRPKQGAD